MLCGVCCVLCSNPNPFSSPLLFPYLLFSPLLFIIQSTLSYTISPFSNVVNKWVHVLLHVSAVVCFSFGIYYIRAFRNTSNNGSDSDAPLKLGGGYVNKSHLMTLHSWIGCGAIALYINNFAWGACVMGLRWGSGNLRRIYTMHHRSLGLLTLITSALAGVSGLQYVSTCSAGDRPYGNGTDGSAETPAGT